MLDFYQMKTFEIISLKFNKKNLSFPQNIKYHPITTLPSKTNAETAKKFTKNSTKKKLKKSAANNAFIKCNNAILKKAPSNITKIQTKNKLKNKKLFHTKYIMCSKNTEKLKN